MSGDLKRDLQAVRWLGVAEGVCWTVAIAMGAASVWLVLQ